MAAESGAGDEDGSWTLDLGCPAHAEIAADITREAGVPGWPAAALRNSIAEGGAIAFVTAAPGCDPDGLVLVRHVDDEAEILLVAVARAVRRRGRGRALVAAALDAAARAGARRAYL